MTWKPWHFITVALAGWMNRQQQEAIEYLRTENRILRERLGHKRILLNDGQKRRLAEAASKLGRDLLRQFGTLFSPETLLKWQRTLVARKYDGSDRRGKRGPKPTKANMIRKLVIQMAQQKRILGVRPDLRRAQEARIRRPLADRPAGDARSRPAGRPRTNRIRPPGRTSSRATGRASQLATSLRANPGASRALPATWSSSSSMCPPGASRSPASMPIPARRR